MKVNMILVNVTSEDPDRLVAFYRDVVGLTLNPDMGGRSFDILPGATLAFDSHSDTAGPTKEPQRVLDRVTQKGAQSALARLERVDRWLPIVRTDILTARRSFSLADQSAK